MERHCRMLPSRLNESALFGSRDHSFESVTYQTEDFFKKYQNEPDINQNF